MKRQVRNVWDWRAVLYTLFAMLMLALRLAATQWAEGIELFVFLITIATGFGLFIGYSRFKLWFIALLGLAYGAFFIHWLYGISLPQHIPWYDRIVEIIWLRLRLSIQQFAMEEPVTDPILFLAILAILTWLIGFIAGFSVSRYQSAWPAILLGGISLISTSYYDASLVRSERYVLIFIFFSIMLVGRLNYLRQKQNWQQEQIFPSPQAAKDIQRAILLVSIIIIAIAWMIPLTQTEVQAYSEFWTNLTQPWKNFTNRIADILEPIESYSITDEAAFGTTLKLGNNISVGTEVLFTVESSQEETRLLKNYWKAQTYDLYINDQWYTSSGFSSSTLFPQDFEIDQYDWLSRAPVTYTFDVRADFDKNIFIVNTPTWLSRAVEVYLIESLPNQQDPVSIFADPPLLKDDVYQVRALVSNASRVELRSASTAYPNWLDRFLQLPSNFPEAIRTLALEITQDLDSPYDKAQAVTSYLRENITYSQALPEIPASVDPIEWFLFTHQEGFCNYYATAEVLMLRSLGIPARLAVGYAEGEYDAINQLFVVRQKDKHAWPEVFFEEYGWIEFEPTSSLPAIERPVGIVENEGTAPSFLPSIDDDIPPIPTAMPTPTVIEEVKPFIPQLETEKTSMIWLLWLCIIFLTGFIALIIWILSTPKTRFFQFNFLRLDKNAHRLNSSMFNLLIKLAPKLKAPLPRLYQMLTKAIERLGSNINVADTPTERGQQLKTLLPELSEKINTVIGEYEKSQYSNEEVDLQSAIQNGLYINKFVRLKQLEQLLKRKRA